MICGLHYSHSISPLPRLKHVNAHELLPIDFVAQSLCMVSEMVQNSQIPYTFTFNDVILVHQYIYSHSTTTLSFNMYTNSHSILRYEYIHSHFRHIHSHSISIFLFNSVAIFIQRFLDVQNSTVFRIERFIILFHEYIYSPGGPKNKKIYDIVKSLSFHVHEA